MLQKWPDLAPRRISDDPIHGLYPIEKIPALANFTPIGSWQMLEKVPLSSAWF
jgi:hypothetical protein